MSSQYFYAEEPKFGDIEDNLHKFRVRRGGGGYLTC